jgi:hypothetical protein
LRVAPRSSGSVTASSPNSGVFVLPTITTPAWRMRATISPSRSGTYDASSRHDIVYGSPATAPSRSLTTKGTPRKGPSGRTPSAAALACSYMRWTTALSLGLTFSMAAIAASTSSRGWTSRLRTRSARAVASSEA